MFPKKQIGGIFIKIFIFQVTNQNLESFFKIFIVIQCLKLLNTFTKRADRGMLGDAQARWTPDRAVWVRAMAGCAEDTLLSQCLSPPRSKWVPANCHGSLTKMLVDKHPIQGVGILLVASCYGNRS